MLKIGEFSKIAQVSVKTLRYYHQYGLLKPAWTDRFNGYRYYSLDQLPALNRILALKELGFSLEQTRTILEQDLTAAELRGMMRLRQAELEQHIRQEQARLEQIEARLQQITHEGALPAYDVVVKPIAARQVAGLRETIRSPHHIPRLFLALQAALPPASLASDPAMPAVGIYYDREYSEQGIDMEAAAPVTGRAPVPEQVRIHQLPGAAQMACAVHKGGLEELHQAHYALAAWAETNRYRVTGPSREVFLRGFEDTQPQDMITEVQFPVERKPTPILIQKYQEIEKMEPKIVTKPAFTVVGMEYYGKNENQEIAHMWQEFYPHHGKIGHKVDPQVCYGVCGDLADDGRFKYVSGFEVSRVEELPDSMVSWDLPESEYVVFPCTLHTIGDTYEFAHGTWLPASDYKRVPIPDFEFYDETFDPEDPESILYVYIPIEKKR